MLLSSLDIPEARVLQLRPALCRVEQRPRGRGSAAEETFPQEDAVVKDES